MHESCHFFLFLLRSPSSGKKEVPYFDLIPRKDDTTMFESAFEWMNALENFLRHIKNRYGEHIVSTWVYELSFFLNDRPYYISNKYRVSLVYEQGYSTGAVPAS